MVATRRKKYPKPLRLFRYYLLITIGCFVLAFGDAAFLSPLNLVTGGVLSIGIISQHFLTLAGVDFYIVDIVVWAVQLILLLVSFLVLGKSFTLRTLYATLIYPALFTLLSRVPMIVTADSVVSVGNHIASFFQSSTPDTGLTILAGIFGGVCVGAGVAITYYSGGSTGGLDVLAVIIAKKTPIKEAVSAFLMDATLVLLGIFVLRDVVLGLIGVISAFSCALTIQYMYVNANAFIIADIISDQYEAIMDYVHTEMDRATTVIDVMGGYTGSKRKILRVAFSRRELNDFRNFVGQVDPRAFVTFTQASMINGEGFDPLVNQTKNKGSAENNEDLHG